MYDRDAVIAAVDLPALADELLGGHRGTTRSPSWPCPNPQHAQTGRTPPVAIFTSRRGEQRWRCHGCGTGGTAVDLVMACCGTSPGDAIDRLARRAGLTEQDRSWSLRRRPLRRAKAEPRGCSDQAGMDRYVEQCAAALFEPAGRRTRHWLNNARGLPDEVLAANRIGADLGPRHQQRPDGMPRAAGVVLPVIVDTHAVYAQLRVSHPRPDGPRYLNPTATLAPNPRLADFQPTEQRHREVIVTEGAIDALSAAAAGYRSVAILSAAYPDQAVALQLSRLPHQLVIAFDHDDAGRAAAERLTELLAAHQRHPVNLALPAADLNDALVQSSNWVQEFEQRVRVCVANQSDAIGRSLA
jgi:DNA primase